MKNVRIILSCYTNSARLRFALLLLLSLIWLLSGSALQADTELKPLTAFSDEFALPEKFGEIVYQTKLATPAKIFIIANGHRSAITGANAADTVQAQIETFRIGEWLINQNQVELLLPEGFFGSMGETGLAGKNESLLDSQALQEALADTSLFVNAELLLHKNYGIYLNQIEDRKIYSSTRELLRLSLAPEAHLSPAFGRELAYLQKLRTATILQSAPEVIETAYQQGRISSPTAMLTIGLSHLDDIIEFLETGEIRMASLQTTSNDFPALEKELELLKKQVSVTVIIPRTLIDQRRRQLKTRT